MAEIRTKTGIQIPLRRASFMALGARFQLFPARLGSNGHILPPHLFPRFENQLAQ